MFFTLFFITKIIFLKKIISFRFSRRLNLPQISQKEVEQRNSNFDGLVSNYQKSSKSEKI